MDLIKQMTTLEDTTETEKGIIDYILSNPDEIANMSIATLANKTYSSNISIIRLCKKLNLSGFKEFKIEFTKSLLNTRNNKKYVDYNYPFNLDEPPVTVANNIALLTKSTIDTCLSNIDFNKLKKVSEVIVNSKNTYAFAIGDSLIRVSSFQNKLIKIGIHIINANNYGDALGYAANTTSNDCALFITYSATDPNFLKFFQILKSKGTKVIIITTNNKSTLCKYADYVILFSDLESNVDSIATFYSQIALEYILNVLYSYIFKLNYSKNKQYKKFVDYKRFNN